MVIVSAFETTTFPSICVVMVVAIEWKVHIMPGVVILAAIMIWLFIHKWSVTTKVDTESVKVQQPE